MVKTMIEKFYALKTVAEGTIVEKKSKFICQLHPIETEEEALAVVAAIRKQHYAARHHCYAYIIYQNGQEIERCNDDGEPSQTAGKPILEVLKGANIKNVIAVVTRYFGGTLLGTGGLIKAYTESTQCAVEQAKLIEKSLREQYIVELDYSLAPKVEYMIHKEEQIIGSTEYAQKIKMEIYTSVNKSESIVKQITELTNGQADIKSGGLCYLAYVDGVYDPEWIKK